MSTWYGTPDLEEIRQQAGDTLVRHLGIEIIEIGDDYLRGTMPVDHRTRQPVGLLHGGASVALAETLGSIGANLTLDNSRQYAVGLEINANHLRAVRDGEVTGTARPLHRGRSTQVWQIEIDDPAGRPVCVSRITLAVLDRADQPAC